MDTPSKPTSRRPVRRRRLAALFAIACLGLTAGAAAAAPGDLDRTYGSDGTTVVDLGAGEWPSDVALAADGGLFVGGDQEPSANLFDQFVAKLSPSGALDRSYGLGTGWSRLAFDAVDFLAQLQVLPDGRIAVVGTASQSPGPAQITLSRLLYPQGTLDPSFADGDGFVRYNVGSGRDEGAGLALQPDGSMVVAGTSYASDVNLNGTDFSVSRWLPSGELDPAFGGGFAATFVDFGGPGQPRADDVVRAMALQADGRTLVAGRSYLGQVLRPVVTRLTADEGALDTSFATGGRAVVRNIPDGIVRDIVVQPDGRILLAVDTTIAGDSGVVVVRLLSNGTLDTSFGSRGVAIAHLSGDYGKMALQPDGKIVVVSETRATGPDDIQVARLLPTGQIDPGFGTNGRVEVERPGVQDTPLVALTASGGIVIVAATRVNDDAPPDIFAFRLVGGDPAPVPAAGTGPAAGAGPAAGVGPSTSSGGTVARCAGKAATIAGTPGPDVLVGTPGPDVIAGRAGADTIAGLGGDDIICGGAGADVLKGGAGADRLLGQAGTDRLVGGAGADRLLGGAGNDRLVGGGGLDVLKGGAGRNVGNQ